MSAGKKAKKKQSRPERWSDAVSRAQQAMGEINELKEKLKEIVSSKLQPALADLQSVKEEYEEWQNNMPESLHVSDTFAKLEAITALEIETEPELHELDDVESMLDEADGVDLPQGFGRD